jgi:hypothetical protein
MLKKSSLNSFGIKPPDDSIIFSLTFPLDENVSKKSRRDNPVDWLKSPQDFCPQPEFFLHSSALPGSEKFRFAPNRR